MAGRQQEEFEKGDPWKEAHQRGRGPQHKASCEPFLIPYLHDQYLISPLPVWITPISYSPVTLPVTFQSLSFGSGEAPNVSAFA